MDTAQSGPLEVIEQFIRLIVHESRSVIEKFVQDNYIDVNSQHNYGVTALHMAAIEGRVDKVELLLKKYHAKPDILASDGMTALMLAVKEGHIDIVKLLLIAKADVNIQNKNGETALMLAVENNNKEIVQLLLNNKANVSVQNNHQWTALMIAANKGYTDIAQLVLSKMKKEDLGISDNYGRTALELAVRKRHESTAKLLLEAGASPNPNPDIKNTTYERSILTLAAEKGYIEMVELLLKHKADPNVLSSDGKTALMVAVEKGHTNIASLLLEAGASIGAKTVLQFLKLKGYNKGMNELLANYSWRARNRITKAVSDFRKSTLSKANRCKNQFH